MASSYVTGAANTYVDAHQIYEKISFKQTFPLFVLLVIILIALVLYHIGSTCKEIAQKINMLCADSEQRERIRQKVNDKLIDAQHSTVTYRKAVQRNVMKGLSSYNILQNPLYKEMFAISWKFAMEHK